MVSLISAPGAIVQPGLDPRQCPALLLVVLTYFAIDHLPVLVVTILADGRWSWLALAQATRQHVLRAVSEETLGILVAVVWLFQPLYLLLFVVPLRMFYVAFLAMAKAEGHRAQLAAVLHANQQLHLLQPVADLLLPFMEAARAIGGAVVVTDYVVDSEQPGRLQRVARVPEVVGGVIEPATVPVPRDVRLEELHEDGVDTLLVPLMPKQSGLIGLLRLHNISRDRLGAEGHEVLRVLGMQAALACTGRKAHPCSFLGHFTLIHGVLSAAILALLL